MEENEIINTLIQLGDRGVTGIRIYYEGGGDSGAIEDITYTTDKLSENEETAFEEISNISQYGDNSGHDLRELDANIYDIIYDFADSKILLHIEDWWNNSGGYGTLCILVPSGKYYVENTLYVSDTEEYFHKGTLIDQSL